MDIKTYLKQLQAMFPDTGSEIWTVVIIFSSVFILLLFNWLVNLLVIMLIKKADTTKTVWDEIILNSIKPPLRLLIWVVGLSYIAEFIWDTLHELHLVSKVSTLSIIYALAWFAVRLLNSIDRHIATQGYQGKLLDATSMRAVNKLLRIATIITAILLTMQTLGYNISGVLAFGGVGGLIVGLAAKDMLANFFGGLMIYLDRPFQEGDWIRSSDRDIEGTVVSIGWRLTQIRTFDRCPLYVPNSMFTSIILENPSRMSHRRFNETIGVRYDDIAKVPVIAQQIEQMMIEHSEIDEQEGLVVSLNEFSDSSVNIKIYGFTKNKDLAPYQATKQDILLKISKIIEAQGAEIAFPTRTLHITPTE
ncbi:MAG: mechanosensitive ion channel family protein [Chromatiales bacterium]|nr:mechanosensitive ion channel family protein [Chromatiales bacterium]